MKKTSDDFSDLFSDLLYEEEAKSIDYEQLFNLNNLYLEFTKCDSIERLADGTLLFKIIDADTDELSEKIFPEVKLGRTGEIISMACRLRDFGYPIGSINITTEGHRLKLNYGLNLHQLKKAYNELTRNIRILMEKYGSDFIQHKDEISYDNIVHDDNKNEDILYQKLLNQFKQYLDSLSKEDSKDLLTALTIYNSSLFIALNDMLAIENYQEKNGQELWETCSKDPNFKDIIYARYDNAREILNSPNNHSAESELIYDFNRLIDYSSHESFMESLKKVTSIIKQHYSHVLLPEDIAVYRGIASDEVNIRDLSKSTFISTSLNAEQASHFTNINNKKYTYLSYITAKKGTPFLMFLTEQAKRQKEVLFFDDLIQIKRIGSVPKSESDIKVNGVPTPLMVYEIESRENMREPLDFHNEDEPSI